MTTTPAPRDRPARPTRWSTATPRCARGATPTSRSWCEACRDQEIVRWTSVPPPTPKPTHATTCASATTPPLPASPRRSRSSHASEGRLLGSISLLRFAWGHARGEVGYWLAAWARGQGHATRAVRLICAWGFSALRLERIDLMAATGNPASQSVAERAGFTREAVLRSYMRGAFERQDMVMFGLLRGDPTHPR